METGTTEFVVFGWSDDTLCVRGTGGFATDIDCYGLPDGSTLRFDPSGVTVQITYDGAWSFVAGDVPDGATVQIEPPTPVGDDDMAVRNVGAAAAVPAYSGAATVTFPENPERVSVLLGRSA